MVPTSFDQSKNVLRRRGGGQTGSAFHHCITVCLFGMLGASVLLPVTPKRITGCRGRTSQRRYGSQSQGGSPLCEMTIAWGILLFRQLLLRNLNRKGIWKQVTVLLDVLFIPPSRLHRPSVDHPSVPVGPEVRGHRSLGVPLVRVPGDEQRVADGAHGWRRHAWGRPVVEARCRRRAEAMFPFDLQCSDARHWNSASMVGAAPAPKTSRTSDH